MLFYKRTRLYRKFFSILLLSLLAISGGCSWLNPFSDSPSVREFDMDNKYQVDMIIKPGDSLLLDMRNPGSGGYEFVGAGFNPDLLELEYFHIINPDSDMAGDFGRWQFVFKALKEGDDIITIHIKRPGEQIKEAYKMAQIKIDKDGEPFIKW